MITKTWLHLSHLACLIAQGVSAPIHLDITDNRVPITLDDQTFNLLPDSASPRWLVMYGVAYEIEKGRGACRSLKTGCYFCPSTHPCDDIFKRPRQTVKFAGGGSIEYAAHNGKLSIGNVTDIKVEFGLIVKFKSLSGKLPFTGTLGLALGEVKPPPMLEQLKKHGVIEKASVAIQASNPHRDCSSGERFTSCMSRVTDKMFDGELVLGGSSKPVAELSSVRFTPLPKFKHLCAAVLRSELSVDSQSQLPRKSSATDPSDLPRQFTHGLVEVGTSVLSITEAEYKVIMNEMRNRMKEKRISLAAPLWVERGMVWAYKEVSDFLPVLEFDLMDDAGAKLTSVRIYPEHYIQGCSVKGCLLDLWRTRNGPFPIGRPFFRAYYTYLNLETKKLFITPNNVTHTT